MPVSHGNSPLKCSLHYTISQIVNVPANRLAWTQWLRGVTTAFVGCFHEARDSTLCGYFYRQSEIWSNPSMRLEASHYLDPWFSTSKRRKLKALCDRPWDPGTLLVHSRVWTSSRNLPSYTCIEWIPLTPCKFVSDSLPPLETSAILLCSSKHQGYLWQNVRYIPTWQYWRALGPAL